MPKQGQSKASGTNRGISIKLPQKVVAEVHEVAKALDITPTRVAGFLGEVVLSHLTGTGSVRQIAGAALERRLASLATDTDHRDTAQAA